MPLVPCSERASTPAKLKGVVLAVLILKWCLVLSIFYGASLVHHNDISGGILVSYAFIALQVLLALTILPPVMADIR